MVKKVAHITLKNWLPQRFSHSNKTDGGVVLIVAGSANYKGAGLLSACAATRSGAGYTHLMTDPTHYPWMKFPDFIVHQFSPKELVKNPAAVIGIGPGLGLGLGQEKLLKILLKRSHEKVVVDADALTILGKLKIKKLPSTWILTPHEGELARLLQVSSALIKKDREKYLEKAYKKYGCTIILKGSETLIASQNKIFKFAPGPVALAKAGTGDVLLGIITAMYAQNGEALLATVAGHCIHSRACADWLKKGNDHLGLRPVDLIEELPKTIKRLRRKPTISLKCRAIL